MELPTETMAVYDIIVLAHVVCRPLWWLSCMLKIGTYEEKPLG